MTTRINTNVGSLVAQNSLAKTNADLQTTLTRLSTGLKINTGKDDPAGLIASEAIRSDITSINSALSNTQRASNIIATADSALGQVSSLLNDVRGLVTQAANSGGLSPDEIAANQLQVDSSLEAINRIAQTTTFQGRRLLDGSLDFVTKQGTGFSTVSDLRIDSANLGATGSVAISVNISSAATKATVSSTGIPASTSAVHSTGTLTFGTPQAANEASGTVSLGDAYTVGASASGSITFANATTPGLSASGTLTLGSGANFTITAKDGTAVDGAIGNSVKVNVTTVANGTASSGSYNAGTNTLNLVIEEGKTGAQVQADLAADANVNALFTVAAGAGAGPTASSDAGLFTGVLSGGTDLTSNLTGFTLTAVDGGQADGLKGNTADVLFTAGASNGASYDATTNKLTVTVAAGATIAQVAAAINASSAGADFSASNVVNGSYKANPADNTLRTDPLTGGTNNSTPATFHLEAVNGQAADGTKGNSTKLNFTQGTTATTTAAYDAATNRINVTVGIGATVNDIISKINLDGTFIASAPTNGTSKFGAADLVLNNPGLTGGTDNTLADVITVTADKADASFNGKTISVIQDNSITAGTATASINTGTGNIEVRVRNSGTVNVSTIAGAINNLDGYSASVTTHNGDGVYDVVNDTAPVGVALANGTQGGGLNADLVIKLTGGTGSEVLQFKQGASVASLVQSINLVKDATGVEATNDAGALKLTSTTYGSKGLVDVEVISEGAGGTFASGLTANRAVGADIVATVNGFTATGSGNTLSLNTSTLNLNLTVADGSSTAVNFTITGGGAQFQLGPDVVSNQQARLGIGSLNTAKLGGPAGRLYELASGGSKSLTADPTAAANVVDEVINKVTTLRGRLGAFQKTTLDSNTNALNNTLTNLYDADSNIRDADFAKESANLTRNQILVQSGTSVLGLANQNPQSVLSLLR